MGTLRLNQKQFGTCERKREAREVTIIEVYRSIFDREALPLDRQYWTLCGQMVDAGTGLFQPFCELRHVVTQGLVSPHQFVGVELNAEIHALNKSVGERTYSKGAGPTFINGEITRVLDENLGRGTLYAEVVNLDLICEPKEGVKILSRTMDILNHIDGPTMLVWNVILSRTWPLKRTHTWSEVAEALNEDSLFRSARPHGWSQFEEKVFPYGGTGNSSTTMGTVVFIRRGRRQVSL